MSDQKESDPQSNPLDDVKLQQNPIAEKIPQGKNYWLMVLLLMVGAGFWQYYVLYHRIPSLPLSWNRFQSKSFESCQVVQKPALIWVINMESSQIDSFLRKCNQLQKEIIPLGKKSDEKENQDEVSDPKDTMVFKKAEFRTPFNTKGGKCFLAVLPKDKETLTASLGGEPKEGFYFFGGSKDKKILYQKEKEPAFKAFLQALKPSPSSSKDEANSDGNSTSPESKREIPDEK